MRVFLTIKRSIFLLFAITPVYLLSGCTTTLVAPYDEKLVTDTEVLFKKAAKMIEEGRAVSPLKDDDREKIVNPAAHKGHYSKFESKYNSLIIDTEALMLRAMASNDKIDSKGQEIQAKISKFINETVVSNCKELAASFSGASLTAKNYVDLKCIVLKWKEQHSDSRLTRNTMILKQANWEGRKLLMFNAILAIQAAEGFKKQKDKTGGQ